MVIDVGTTGKVDSSACYNKQQISVHLQPFLAMFQETILSLSSSRFKLFEVNVVLSQTNSL